MRYALVMLYLLLVALACLAGPPQVPKLPQAPPVQLWASPMPFPEGATQYRSAKHTQSIYVRDGVDTIDKVPIASVDARWHQSGGMEGLTGWKSEKYRLLPSPPVTRVDTISIWNGYNYQGNRGIVRSYPDGTRFDDVLTNSTTGAVFEHRMRHKTNGVWRSRVLYEDASARPVGYAGLTVTCSGCHKLSGSGGYGEGLVPGGDTVLGAPLDWSVWTGAGVR